MTHPSNSAWRYRIGALSKLTGIPVTTLRVWETRYGAFTPMKTSGRHRLYQQHDVLRAQLFKQLTADGHAISTLAALDVAQLAAMRNEHRVAQVQASQQQIDAHSVCLAVVGLGLAGRIASSAFTLRFLNHALKVSDVWPDLNALSEHAFTDSPQLVLVQLEVLDEAALAHLRGLTQRAPDVQVMVLYNYGTSSALAVWQGQGWVLRRAPLSDAELAEWVSAVLIVDAAQAMGRRLPNSLIPARKYDDETLQRVASLSPSVLCACPQHVAELITQLAHFEAYSHACLSRHAKDAEVHAFLASVSGSARALFERALERVAEHEGLTLSRDGL